MQILKLFLLSGSFFLSIFFLSPSVFAELAENLRGPDPKTITGRNMDLTVYRTVNTLSCHPQNPLLTAFSYFPYNLKGKVPLMISFNPDRAFQNITQKGYCVSMHMAEYADIFKKYPVPLPTPRTGEPWPTHPPGVRPPIPWRHFVVMEFPNPSYDPTVAQSAKCKSGQLSDTDPDKFKCGKYIHWEGMVANVNSSKSGADGISIRETWHLFGYRNNWFGGIDAWNNIMKFNYKEYTPTGTSTPQSLLDFDEAVVNFKTCEGVTNSNEATLRRPGDINLPCYTYSVSLNADSIGDTTHGKVYWNPTHYTDIPHNKYGYVTSTDKSWVKCLDRLPVNYFKQTISEDGNDANDSGFGSKNPPPVFPVVPEGCDYPALSGNPGAPPLCLNQTLFGPYDPIPQSLEACKGTITISPSPTHDPNATPTPYRYHGDITTPYGIVDIRDYNAIMTDMTSNNMQFDVNGNNKIDIFDYNTIIRYFGSI